MGRGEEVNWASSISTNSIIESFIFNVRLELLYFICKIRMQVSTLVKTGDATGFNIRTAVKSLKSSVKITTLKSLL